MSVLKIVTIPKKILRQKSLLVDKITPELNRLINDMIDTLRSKPGLGIAAPQVGRNVQIIIIESRGLPRLNPEVGGEKIEVIPLIVLINPKIIKSSQKKIEIDEGCFSVPNIFGPVTRPEKVKIEALNKKGKRIQLNASGLLARVLQHEIDHLNGILFIDLVEDKSRLKEIKPGEGIQG